MPLLREKAQRAWAELQESCEMVLEIEKEGLRLAQFKTEKSCHVMVERLRRRKR